MMRATAEATPLLARLADARQSTDALFRTLRSGALYERLIRVGPRVFVERRHEHRLMHAEALAYKFHQLPLEYKVRAGR